MDGQSAAFTGRRTAFGPEALARLTQILEEVTLDLVGDGVPIEQARSAEMRTRLAQRLLGLGGFCWTDTQIKQLLLRALRNELSASRTYATVVRVKLEPTGTKCL
jgi:hypothetical protein